jgi:hypothetical protein
MKHLRLLEEAACRHATLRPRKAALPQSGLVILTVTRELDGAPSTAVFVNGDAELGGRGGLPMMLSDLKTFLETGSSFRLK